MYLWSWAAQRRWRNPTPGRPLPESITRTLWTKAAKEPVALPYLKETAVLLLKRWRSANHLPAPVGDSLEASDRNRLARQYLSVFETCETEVERVAVVWMILDLHGARDDPMIYDWYTTETRPELRINLLMALSRTINPPKEANVRVRRARQRGEEVLLKRAPILRELARVAAKDWHPEASHQASVLLEGLKTFSANE